MIILLLLSLISLWVFIKLKTKTNEKCIVIVLGSGGHTAEMIYLTSQMNFDLYDRIHVFVSHTDKMSKDKFLNELGKNSSFKKEKCEFIVIRRTNEVGDGKLISVFKTLLTLFLTIPKVIYLRRIKAGVFNGPGVCFPVIFGLYLKNVNLSDPFF